MIEILGPVDPELQERDPATDGWVGIKTGTQAAMERHGKAMKKANPERHYRISTYTSWITWHSEYDVRDEAVRKGQWKPNG